MTSIIDTIWQTISYLPLREPLKGQIIKLVHWPDFSHGQPLREYIVLADLLSGQPMTPQQLKKLSGYDEHLINSFLNAAHLMSLLDVSDSTRPKQQQSSKARSNNPFKLLSGLLSRI
ncbi:hypothetical protein ACFODZ_07660 [Marinicella sediminis]|uniref:Uncharacterized protein n=1 Tax=Marinicella sediminis TaxID=1792834 RepID=A0ABV7JBK7_9GAMM|nr:hypothetical protein [Marinicella sediminis]